MKIYRSITFNMATGETIAEDSYEYDGPLAECQYEDIGMFFEDNPSLLGEGYGLGSAGIGPAANTMGDASQIGLLNAGGADQEQLPPPTNPGGNNQLSPNEQIALALSKQAPQWAQLAMRKQTPWQPHPVSVGNKPQLNTQGVSGLYSPDKQTAFRSLLAQILKQRG